MRNLGISFILLSLILIIASLDLVYRTSERSVDHKMEKLSKGNAFIRVEEKSIYLYIHPSVPEYARPAIYSSVQKWNKALGRELLIIGGVDIECGALCENDGINMIYWIHDRWDFDHNMQAITSSYYENRTIKRSEIRVNAKDFSFFIGDEINYSEVHLESLIIHELGHVLCLDHEDKRKSVMGTYLQFGQIRNTIAAVDSYRASFAFKGDNEKDFLSRLTSASTSGN